MLFRLTSILVFVAVTSIALFGFLGMGHNYGASCIASLLQRTACPETSTILDGVSFYTNTLRGFSTAIFDSASMAVFVLSLLLCVSAVFSYMAASIPQKSFVTVRPTQYFVSETIATEKISRWLAMLLKRDPYISF